MGLYIINDATSAAKAEVGMKKDFGVFTNTVLENLKFGMFEIGKEVLRETEPITPRKTGALRNSAKFRVKKEDENAVLSITFGGVAPSFPSVNVDYALERHEVLAKVYTIPGTTWKYLTIGAIKSFPKGGK